VPDKNMITGVVASDHGVELAGLKVQAFDRDLPSLERRVSGPQLLAEATTDRKGRFQIEYDIERFSRGDAPSPRGRWRTLKADVTFRIFDAANREMRVTSVTGGDRDLGPNEVAFNVPAAVEVTIVVEAVPPAEESEYERLLALLAPVLEDLSRADVLDDDVAFLFHELQLDQQPETRQRIEWLRRCAVLAAQSGLSEDTFYGWGRKGLPEALDSLAARPLPSVSSILIELLDWTDEALDEALRAASVEQIIPSRPRAGFVDVRARLKTRRSSRPACRIRAVHGSAAGCWMDAPGRRWRTTRCTSPCRGVAVTRRTSAMRSLAPRGDSTSSVPAFVKWWATATATSGSRSSCGTRCNGTD
jgi:hypothetical protein